MIFVVGFLLVFGTTYFLTGALRRYALRRELIDKPNERGSHSIPTPRGGGLAIVIVYLAGIGALYLFGSGAGDQFLSIFIGGLIVGAVGFWDDHRHVTPFIRVLFHFSAAFCVLFVLEPSLHFEFAGDDYDLGSLGMVLILLFIVWMINLYNFMDGIDGIAGIEAVTVSLSGALLLFLNQGDTVPIWLCLFAATTCGFLIWNWPPAKVFLGDSGSGFLGFVLAVFAVMTVSEGQLTVWSWLILLGVFIVDATFTLTRRIVTGTRWYEAHRSHAYQHAAIRWRNHKRVTLAVLAINMIWLFPLAFWTAFHPDFGFILTIVAYAPLVGIAIFLDAGAPTYHGA